MSVNFLFDSSLRFGMKLFNINNPLGYFIKLLYRPALVIKIGDLRRWILLGVQQGCQQNSLPEPLASITDSARLEFLRKFRVFSTQVPRKLDFNEIVPATQLLDHMPLRVAFGPDQPVALRTARTDLVPQQVVDEISVQDRDRLIGNPLNEGLRQGQLTCSTAREGEVQQQVAAQRHQAHGPYLGIS